MVFDASLTDEDLAVLLASEHVAGKIRWDAYEQAKHVSDLVLWSTADFGVKPDCVRSANSHRRGKRRHRRGSGNREDYRYFVRE